MQASRCSMQDRMPMQVLPVQRRLLRPNSFCTPGLSLLSRNVAIAPRDRHRCLPRASSEQLGIGRAARGESEPQGNTSQYLWQQLTKGLMVLPLLAAALLAPGAARAAFVQASKPMAADATAAFEARDDERPRQARDMQYPRWQRLQWANWRELQLSNEAKRRFAAAILASGILLVLALKLIATKAADLVLDTPADKPADKKQAAGWKGAIEGADSGAGGRRRQAADALAAKSSSQGRPTSAAASAAAATMLSGRGSGIDRGASQPGRARLEDVRRINDSFTAKAAAADAPPRPASGQPIRVARSSSPPPPPVRTGPPPPPKVVSFKTPGKSPQRSLDEQESATESSTGSSPGGQTTEPLLSEELPYDALFHGGDGNSSTATSPWQAAKSQPESLSQSDTYDPLFHSNAAAASSKSATPDISAGDDIYDPSFHGDAATAKSDSADLSSDDIYDPLFHRDVAASESVADTVDFPRADDGHASDIDAMAAEIARGALSDSDDEGAPDLYNYQLAAEVVAGRRPEEEPEVRSLGTQRVSNDEAYRRALATQRSAASPFVLAMGFMRAAFDTVTKPSAALAASRLKGPGRVLSVQREGQSLTVTMRAPSGAPDGSTAAERAERAVLSTSRPLRGLVGKRGLRIKAPERRYARFAKYDLFYEALTASSAANPDAKYNPVRAVLDSIPSRGAAKYDMVGSLLEGTVMPQRGQNGRSKYDVVWQLLRAGREGGATAAPKFDPVYDLLRAATWVADWGQNYQDTSAFSDWGPVDKYDPVLAVLGAEAPKGRSRLDPLQALLAVEPPSGSSKYDMVGSILAAAQAAPDHAPRSGPVYAALSLMREIVGLDPAPVGPSKYDPAPDLLGVSPAAPTGRSKYDLFSWLRTRSLGSDRGKQVTKAGAFDTPPSKYDPAMPLLGALAGPPPNSPDDPLRAAIRRAARQARSEAPDMAVGRAFVFRGPRGVVAVPVKDNNEAPSEGSGEAVRSNWPWRGFWTRGSSSGSGAESPYDAQLAAASQPAGSSASTAASGATAANSAPAAEADYDPVPDLFKLWSALKASSARLDPLDAVNVISNRGAGDRFFHVASAYRRLAEDGALRAKHGELYAMLDGMRGRVSVPEPTPRAVRSAHALLREADAQYAPVHALLKGRDGADIVRTMCVLHDLLAPAAQQQHSQQEPQSQQQSAAAGDLPTFSP